MLLGMPKQWMTWSRNVTAFSEDACTRGMYSIHLENLSISTKTHVNFPGAGLKGPIISSPSMRRAKRLVSSGSHVLVRGFSWRRTDNPHSAGLASLHQLPLTANRTLLGRPYRPVFLRPCGCRRSQSGFGVGDACLPPGLHFIKISSLAFLRHNLPSMSRYCLLRRIRRLFSARSV